MSDKRFNGEVPHVHDTNLIERCQEQIRDYDINYKGWVEEKNHTLSYLAAAYIELAKKYDHLVGEKVEHTEFMRRLEEEKYESMANETAALASECCGNGCHED